MIKPEVRNSKKLPALPGLEGQKEEKLSPEFRSWGCSAACLLTCALTLSVWATKNKGFLQEVGTWKRHKHCQKYWPKQGKKERHTLASPHLLYSKRLLRTFISQTNRKPIGKEAWAMFCRNPTSMVQSRAGEAEKRNLRANRQMINNCWARTEQIQSSSTCDETEF